MDQEIKPNEKLIGSIQFFEQRMWLELCQMNLEKKRYKIYKRQNNVNKRKLI